MKILCVIDSLGSGGAQRQLVFLALEFKKRGYDVSFLVYHRENFFKDILVNVKIQIVEIIEPSYLKRLFKIRKYIRNGNYNAVLSFLEAANFICEFAGLPRRNWKLVVGERSSNPNIFESYKLRFYRWFHIFADFVVSNSYENLKMVRMINPLLPERKCKVIYNIVDFDIWKPTCDYTFFKGEKLNMVVVASHQYLKNAQGLIKAVQCLTNEDKSKLKIDWYGDEQPNNSLKEAKELVLKYKLEKIFSFFAASKNISQKMESADVLGLFSFYEGLPNVICESMMLGKTVIASNVSDIPLLIDEEFIFDPKNISEIKSILSFLIKLPENELTKHGAQNKKKALALFDKNYIVDSYLNLFTR
ncbi:MAG: glycosyltransferase [Ferruginibacter sp.]